MDIVARAFPVRSKSAAIELAKAIDKWSEADKKPMADAFGGNGKERWYFQEIEGKPYVVSVAIVVDAESGYEFLRSSDDPFATWFRAQVAELSNVDLSTQPRGPQTEFIYEFQPN